MIPRSQRLMATPLPPPRLKKKSDFLVSFCLKKVNFKNDCILIPNQSEVWAGPAGILSPLCLCPGLHLAPTIQYYTLHPTFEDVFFFFSHNELVS